MKTEYIRVTIGLIDGIFPVTRICSIAGAGNFYEHQAAPGKTAWTHAKWCTPCLADGTPLNADGKNTTTDTDWRAYLKAHWDEQRGHIRTDCFEQFYAIFRNACACHMQGKPTAQSVAVSTLSGQKPHAPVPEQKKTKEFRQSNAATTHKQRKAKHRAVELSLFPNL